MISLTDMGVHLGVTDMGTVSFMCRDLCGESTRIYVHQDSSQIFLNGNTLVTS